MSYADPEEGKKGEPAPAPKKEPLFVLLEEIRDAINEGNAQNAHHLDRIATALEGIAKNYVVGIPSKTPTPIEKKPEVPSPAPKPAPMPTPATTSALEKVKSSFTQDLIDMLNFEEKEDSIIIKPRRFLGSDNFAKIAAIVRNIGGEYISAGKDSCFKVQKK